MIRVEALPASLERRAELDAAESLLALIKRAASGLRWAKTCHELQFQAQDGPFQIYVPTANAREPCPWCAKRCLWFKRVLALPNGAVRCSLCRLDC